MSVESEITRISTAKEDIKNSLISKNQVPLDTERISDFSKYIDNIIIRTSGGGAGIFIYDNINNQELNNKIISGEIKYNDIVIIATLTDYTFENIYTSYNDQCIYKPSLAESITIDTELTEGTSIHLRNELTGGYFKLNYDNTLKQIQLLNDSFEPVAVWESADGLTFNKTTDTISGKLPEILSYISAESYAWETDTNNIIKVINSKRYELKEIYIYTMFGLLKINK